MRTTRMRAVLLVSVLAAAASADTVTFSDGDFAPADYETSETGTGSSTATTEATGGNPDAYRRISLTVAPFQNVTNAQLLTRASWTPGSQGAIRSARVAYDVRRVFTSVPGATQIRRGLAVKQGGVVHTVQQGVTTSTAWAHFEVADIVPLFPGVDWTDGSAITFGFMDDVATSATGFTLDGGYDNFEVEIDVAAHPVLLRIVDQDGAEIAGSLIRRGSDFYPTGSTVTLPEGQSTFQVLPAIVGGPTVNFGRIEAVEVAPTTTELTFQWITRPVTLRLEDQHGVEIPGSSIRFAASGGIVATGSSATLPVSDPAVYPTLFGSLDVSLLPGVFGGPQLQHLSRPEIAAVTASTTELDYEWTTKTVTFRLNDQDGNELTGSLFRFVLGTVATGSPVTLPIVDTAVYANLGGGDGAGYRVSLVPSVFGGPSDNQLVRTGTPAVVTEATDEIAYEWIGFDCRLALRSAAAAIVPGSTLSPHTVGAPTFFPVNDPATYPTIAGNYAAGYPITVVPGDVAPASATIQFRMMPDHEFDPATFEIGGNSYRLSCDLGFQIPFFETGDLFAWANQGTDLFRFDVTEPLAITETGSCTLTARSGFAFDADGNLYAANPGLRIYDRNLQLIGQVPAGVTLDWPTLRSDHQLVACGPRDVAGHQIHIFDTSDLSAPTLANVVDVPFTDHGGCRPVFDAAGRLWVMTGRGLVRARMDAAGNILDAALFVPRPTADVPPLSPINSSGLAFQASTGLMFLTATNYDLVAVYDPADPTTPVATIHDVCGDGGGSTWSPTFDSDGNLYVECPSADIITFAGASLAGLSGSVQAADLSPGRLSDPFAGSGELAFNPKGKSRDPFSVDAGMNIAVLSEDQGSTSLLGSVTTNPLAETFRMRWLLGGEVVAEQNGVTSLALSLGPLDPLTVGDHVFTFEAEGCMLTVRDTVVVTVENSPPTAAPSGGGVFPSGSAFVVGGQVADHDGDLLSYEWRLGMTILASGTVGTILGGGPVALPGTTLNANDLGVGVHDLDLAVDDGTNAEVVASITVEIFQSDTTAPMCDPDPSTTILWPPNHEMHVVTIAANASDDSGGPVTLAVTVESSDLPDADGDGNTIPDYAILDDGNADGTIRLSLRAERAGKGDGRVYTITITATDEAGNSSTCEVEIRAPHSKGNNQ